MNSILSSLFFLAQTQTPEEALPIWAELLGVLAPWVIILAVVWFFLWRILSRYQRPLQERSFEHMDRVEAKTDEMVELLKQINDKLGPPSS